MQIKYYVYTHIHVCTPITSTNWKEKSQNLQECEYNYQRMN